MDLGIKNNLFVVTGGSSGLGKGVASALLREGAKVIIVARDRKKLVALQNEYQNQIEILSGDITQDNIIEKLKGLVGNRFLSGLVINAGGPPAKSFIETDMKEWDDAYQNILRWKVKITKVFLPIFRKQNYGRIVYIESSSVKQPVKNLVLSNSLRLAVVGFVKTLSQEVARLQITLNILAPGFHETPAAERLFVKRAAVEGISGEKAKQRYESEIAVGRMGDTDEFGLLAAWLLSKNSGYITGQTISVDGGMVKGTFG
jgi:3-oxoacyl-[acyl-carrier protein] reductase